MAEETQQKDSEPNVKETIESILVAFILAFVFRGFVVEAFVIPTGSMAPTLMGAHLRFKCDDCGYDWTVNYSGPGDGDDVIIPSHASDTLIKRDGTRMTDSQTGQPLQKVYHVTCPNCGYRVQRRSDLDVRNSATNPPVHYGDRILVLKYLYLFQKPSRWDVVVFKSPVEPNKYDYQQNYIKRLIGRPGETIMLLDGDVYVAPNVEGADPSLDDFVVQTKPRHAQNSLWRIVYDNDYLPRNLASGRSNGTEPNWTQPWSRQMGQAGWQPLSGRAFNFDNPNGAADILFDADANPAQHSLRDWVAYDVTGNQGPDAPADTFTAQTYSGDENVSDVLLNFYYQRTSGEGPLRASLSKLDRTFTAEITPNKVTLYTRTGDGDDTIVSSVNATIDTTQPTHVEFSNCDYQVTLRVNDKDVIQTTPDQYHPDIHALFDAFNERQFQPKPTIRISAARQKCSVTHLSLWRDVYYLNRVSGSKGPLQHATPMDFPQNLMRLQSDPPEYFCCGDNSAVSLDGRYWPTPIQLPHEDLDVESGKVPGRFLQGKAFFVYWPAGFRPLDSAPAVVPNFGDMRFIH